MTLGAECAAYFGTIGLLALLFAVALVRYRPPVILRPYVHDDLFARNLAAIMAEERLALSILNPRAFLILGGIT